MAIIISICVAIAICVVLFPKEIETGDLSGIIFILGVTVLGVLTLSTPAPLSGHFAQGPGMIPMAGAGMLFLVAGGTQSKWLTVLNRIPSSAYKAVAPAIIGVLATLALVLIVLL